MRHRSSNRSEVRKGKSKKKKKRDTRKKNFSEILKIKNNLIRYLGKDKTGIKLMLLSLMYYLIRECYLVIILLNDDFCD